MPARSQIRVQLVIRFRNRLPSALVKRPVNSAPSCSSAVLNGVQHNREGEIASD